MTLIFTFNDYLESIEPHTIFNAKEIYERFFKNENYNAFYKKLSRLETVKKIKRLSKGIYYKTKISQFGLGEVPISDRKIVDYFLGKDYENGIFADYALYKKYNLTTQVPYKTTILTTKTDTHIKNIDNICIKKLPNKLTYNQKEALEFVLIADKFNNIECLDYDNLYNYFKNISKKINLNDLYHIIETFRIKKKTISQLKNILNYFHVSNELNKYLSSLSTYKMIRMEELYDFK